MPDKGEFNTVFPRPDRCMIEKLLSEKFKAVNFAGINYFEPYPGWKKNVQNATQHLPAKMKKEDAGVKAFSFRSKCCNT